jgi:hypothetical protein
VAFTEGYAHTSPQTRASTKAGLAPKPTRALLFANCATLRECRPRGGAAGHRDNSDRRARRWPDQTGAIGASPKQ